MSDPRIPRISDQAREARRPLPVDVLLSARQETIHRDPGAARAARSVKVSDPLPPEVLKLLGDDATPESVASRMQRAADWSAKVAGSRSRVEGEGAGTVDAESAYDYALAAAAIRECEARRAMRMEWSPRLDKALKDARRAYDALRNWRKL